MDRNSEQYKREAARAVGATFAKMLIRLEKVPERSLSPQLLKVKRRLQQVRK